MPMPNVDPDLVRDLFELHLNTSTRRTARFLGVTQRAAQRWVSVDDPAQMPADLVDRVHGQAELVREYELFDGLETIFENAIEKGIDREVLGAILMALYERYGSDEES